MVIINEFSIERMDLLRLGWAIMVGALDLHQFRRSGILGHN
jgi:hypothetical protein